MQSTRTLMFAGLAAAGLALAGCGGGGSSSTSPTAAQQCATDGGDFANGACTNTLADRQDAQQGAIDDAIKAAEAAKDDIDAANPTTAQVNALNEAIGDLEAAIDAAEDVDGASTKYAANVTGYKDYAELAATAVRLETSLAKAEDERDRLADEKDARDDKDQAALDKMKAEEARKLAVGLDADFPELTTGTPAVTARHGKTATVDHASGQTTFFAAATPVVPDPNFKDTDSKSIAALNGWSGTELMSSPKGGPTDVMRVYTNVDAGERVPFAEWAADISDVTYASGAVSNPENAANAKYVAGAAFATGSGSKSHKANRDTDTSTDGLETFETSGTFAGAPGTYTCTGTCSSAVAGSNGGVNLTGTWTFTPNSGAMAHAADTSYQHFGWWLRKADTGYRVHVFVGTTGTGDSLTPATTLALGGTATYTGSAAGKYSIYDSGPKGGHFTADVELKAKFNGATAGVGTISGMVDGFKGDTAGMDTWSVKLPELSLNDDGNGGFASTALAASKPVWTIGDRAGTVDDDETDSAWSGNLYAADDGGTPQVAVGTFVAEYDHVGNMVGAFGAKHSGE